MKEMQETACGFKVPLFNESDECRHLSALSLSWTLKFSLDIVLHTSLALQTVNSDLTRVLESVIIRA